MNGLKPITIVGGGLAGLTLGIGLRRRNVPVIIQEAGAYPRHRVCGEFISGRGQQTLRRLGLDGLLNDAGVRAAQSAKFFSPRDSSPAQPLPEPAWCLSRHKLDFLLAKEFQKLGGELQTGVRRREEEFGEGIVRATGRRLQPKVDGRRWFGLKLHARNVSLDADLEMHLMPQGYVGLCRLADGEVNACGLFRRGQSAAETAPAGEEWLRGLPGSLLRQRMDKAEVVDGSFCAVAGLSPQPQLAAARGECCLGDAITMIPPVTGNGMSLAFESAEIALEPLTRWSRGELSWQDARTEIASHCDETFGARLRWAGRLQKLLFVSSIQNLLVQCLPRQPLLWRMLFERTR